MGGFPSPEKVLQSYGPSVQESRKALVLIRNSEYIETALFHFAEDFISPEACLEHGVLSPA